MNRLADRVLVAAVVGSALLASCRAENVPDAAALLGAYSSVTESACNVEVALAPEAAATIVETCRAEDGSHRDRIDSTAARWSRSGDRIVLSYGATRDTLRHDAALSHADYGGRDAGPGLELVGSTSAGSRLSDYRRMWKRPPGGQP